jgi:hypothetical protein
MLMPEASIGGSAEREVWGRKEGTEKCVDLVAIREKKKSRKTKLDDIYQLTK